MQVSSIPLNVFTCSDATWSISWDTVAPPAVAHHPVVGAGIHARRNLHSGRHKKVQAPCQGKTTMEANTKPLSGIEFDEASFLFELAADDIIEHTPVRCKSNCDLMLLLRDEAESRRNAQTGCIQDEKDDPKGTRAAKRSDATWQSSAAKTSAEGRDEISGSALRSKASRPQDVAEVGSLAHLAALGNEVVGTHPYGATWHEMANHSGELSKDRHVFSKRTTGPPREHPKGMTLSTLCILFESTFRQGGRHEYIYRIVEGTPGAADGVGFVFDTRIRRSNIQRMRSIFLNRHGRLCIRNNADILVHTDSLPKLCEGSVVFLTVDLDIGIADFRMQDGWGRHLGSQTMEFRRSMQDRGSRETLTSGFFCAIVTGKIVVSLH